MLLRFRQIFSQITLLYRGQVLPRYWFELLPEVPPQLRNWLLPSTSLWSPHEQQEPAGPHRDVWLRRREEGTAGKQSLWQLRVRSWAPSSPGIFSNHIIHILIKNTLTVNYLRNRIQKPFLFIKNWNIFIKLNTLIINYLRNRMQKPFH